MIDIETQLRSYQKASNIRGETRNMCGRAADEIVRLRADNERLREGLGEIDAWSRAYPLKVFPEPDFAVAAAVLKADGRVTLDAISASSMRHVVEGVGKIARRALVDEQKATE